MRSLSIFIISILLLGLSSMSNSKTIEKKMIETRGVWVDKSDVYKGKEYISDLFDKITDANLNTVYLPVLHRGYVSYPESKFLPQDPRMIEIDQNILDWLIDESRKRGLTVEAWPEFGFYAYHTMDAESDPSRGVMLDKYPQLTAIDMDGKPYLRHPEWGDFYSYCPSNPKSHKIMTDILTEIITRYDFDAINLDRVRYPRKEFCFCDYCKKEFQKKTKIKLTKENLDKNDNWSKFYDWRKEQLTKFMKQFSSKARKVRPDIFISSDVWIPEEIDPKGQDWSTWLKKNYTDVVIPMMYWDNIEPGLTESIELSPDSRRIISGISAEVNTSENLVNQINLTRELKGGGVVFWYLGKLEPHLDYLKSTLFQEPAEPYMPR